MTVRSAILYRGQISSIGDNLLTTVPVGSTWLIKTINIYDEALGGQTFAVRIDDATGLLKARLVRQQVPVVGQPLNVFGWWVAEANDKLVGSLSNATAVDIAIFGANLI